MRVKLKYKLLFTNLIVVSEKIIIIKPKKNVKNLICLYFECSLEYNNSNKDISIRRGI